jgi:hypothetical protein
MTAQRRASVTGTVINATDRFVGRRPGARQAEAGSSAVVIKPDFDSGCWTAERMRRACAPSVKLLPFVQLRSDGNPYAPAVSNWNVTSSENPREDFKRGKAYAAMTIQALKADDCSSRELERIFEAIVADAVARRRKGGKGSRRILSPVADGFIHQLSRAITGWKPSNS